jgi:hypothetical protein
MKQFKAVKRVYVSLSCAFLHFLSVDVNSVLQVGLLSNVCESRLPLPCKFHYSRVHIELRRSQVVTFCNIES